MSGKITLRTAGIIAGASAVFAFLFGIIITASLPNLVNRVEASPELTSPMPLVNEQGSSPFADIAEQVLPSVVNISAERKVRGDFPGFEWRFEGPFDEFFRDFFKDFPKPEGKTQTLGSGFLISEDGYLITNYHVIKDASAIVVKLTDKKEYKGDDIKIVGVDPRTDVALLKIERNEKFPHLKLGDSEKARVGDWAIAVGNPYHLDGTVTVGVISAKSRTGIALPEGPDFQSFIQTDAAINPGNSGGPLVNIQGEVIGINTAITSPSGGNVGIGFAIPINLAKSVLDDLKTKGKVTRGYLGVYLQEITEDLKTAMKLSSLEGILISEVMQNTPASRAGIKSGDVVIEFDGKKVKDVESFRMQVAQTPVGKKVRMKIIREGNDKIIDLTMGEFTDESIAKVEREEEVLLGLRVVEVNDPKAQRFDLNVKDGIVVIDVEPNSPAEDAGIQQGDVILAIGKSELKDLKGYRAAIAKLEKGKPVIFNIQRAERIRYIAVTP